MKNKRKRVLLAVVGAAVLLAAGVFGVWQYRRATWRYPYSPETREVNYSPFMPAYLPSMETNLRLSDLVVRGRVTSDAQAVDTVTTLTGKTGVYLAEDFDFHVEEVLFGSLDTDTITLRCWGKDDTGCAKPHRNDELILFLSVQPTTDFAYIPVSDESSMFAVMPGNQLYAFSGRFSDLDGQPITRIYEQILEAAENIRDNPDEYEDTPYGGQILTGLLDPQSDILSPLESIVESAS